MKKLLNKLLVPAVSSIFLLNMASVGYAETTVSAEVGFVFNTFLFLVCGFLVMFMAAGFAMLEAGSVTSKSVSVICAKNIGLFSIAGMMFWLVGYNLAYGIPEYHMQDYNQLARTSFQLSKIIQYFLHKLLIHFLKLHFLPLA